MPFDVSQYHVLVGNAATGEGEDVQAQDPGTRRYTGHYGIVASDSAIIVVGGYIHDLRLRRREPYVVRLSAGTGSYAVSEIDVSKPSSGRGDRPDQIDIPTLALHVSLPSMDQATDVHWEQPDTQQPIDLRWEFLDIDESPAFKLFLAYRLIPV